MSPDLEKKLFEKYPKIFADVNKSPQESLMAFGLEVDDGWYYLIDLLCEALTYTYTCSIEVDEEDGKRLGIKPYIDKEGVATYYYTVHAPQVVAEQVKEKFGTLRFYYRLEYDKDNQSLAETRKYPQLEEMNKRFSNYLSGVVHFADVASSRICEVSGEKGELRVKGGWLKTLSQKVVDESENFEGYEPYIDPEI